jgi:arsenate reductase
MPRTVIYHNPRCSKSRQTLELLHSNGVEPEVVEYLATPPDAATLRAILDMLGLQPRELMRREEAEYKALNLDDDALSADQLIAAMAEHPRLIQRPIVVRGARAAIGRPPEQVLGIL